MNNIFANFGLEQDSSFGENAHVYHCSQDQFETFYHEIQNQWDYIWLVDIVAYEKKAGQQVLIYHFISFDDSPDFSISFDIIENTPVKSISHIWRNATALEQEIWELHGISFSREYQRNYPFAFSVPPMSKAFKNEQASWSSDLKPQFDLQYQLRDPLKKNQYQLYCKLKRNLINECQLESGHFHIGLEKILEGQGLMSVFSMVESYFNHKSPTWAFLLSQAVEDHNKWEIPERARALRMILLELNRVQDHIQFLKSLSIEIVVESLYSHCLLWEKRIQSLFLSYCGNEFGAYCIKPGGVFKDIDQVWLARTLKEIHQIEHSLVAVYRNLILGSSLKELLGFELFSKNIADLWCVTGPLARAVGLNMDLRKSSPFYYYSDVEFDVPIGAKGLAYDLLLIRFEEIFQSLKIIVQLLDNMPTGSFLLEELSTIVSTKSELDLTEDSGKTLTEAVQNYMNIGDKFSRKNLIEGSNGIVALTLDYRNQSVNRLKMTTQSFALKALFERAIKGQEVSVLPPMFAIFDINLKEVER